MTELNCERQVHTLHIKRVSIDDAPLLSRYYLENRAHLQPWEPFKSPGFDSTPAWAERIKQREAEQRAGRAAYFIGYVTSPTAMIASCSLTGITRGAFQACFMGYSVAATYEGQGYMKHLCRHVIRFAFEDLHLHRIMANYMPHNTRSALLLESLGFEKEGLAREYLKINGRWEDHVLTSLRNPEQP